MSSIFLIRKTDACRIPDPLAEPKKVGRARMAAMLARHQQGSSTFLPIDYPGSDQSRDRDQRCNDVVEAPPYYYGYYGYYGYYRHYPAYRGYYGYYRKRG